MGSFNDILLCPENGAQIAPERVSSMNRKLHRLQSEAYQQALDAQRERTADTSLLARLVVAAASFCRYVLQQVWRGPRT